MSGENNGVDIGDLDEMVTGEGDDGTDDSDSNGEGGRRKTIIVKSLYGTKQIPPDTECEKCNRRAVGVLVLEKKMGNKVTKKTRPLCSRHRDIFKEDVGSAWELYDFRRFVDQ